MKCETAGPARKRRAELNRLVRIKSVTGLIPICAACGRIREGERWTEVKFGLEGVSADDFTHGLCPECTKRLYPEIYRRLRRRRVGGLS